jgi:prepilin-type N-terminal cleavage/methylation domain-containing protein
MKTSALIRCVRAFTLLEIIIALIIASIVAAMMVPFLSSTLARSVDSVISAQSHAYLNQVMETITADFKNLSATNPTPLQTLSNNVANNTYGLVYTVVTNGYISFSSGNPATQIGPTNNNILKVTISYRGYTLTALFTR